ncbi:MAG TPA: response regulator, partial [Planctomycetota bacterium]|nr:response regulator [Planctomycetota bacterium]
RFRIAAESTTDLIWEWDVTAGTLEWYGPVDACLGYAPGEFPRSLDAWEKAIHPGERARVIEALDRHLKERVPYEAEYRVFRKDGSIRVWTDRGRALFNAAGQAVKMVGACADVTEKRALEEELREARKMEALGQLAGGVAHNFNNLMQGVLGYSELALERLSEEDPVRKDLEEIRKASQRASDLTQRILAYGRKQFLRPSVFDINEVIRDLVRMLGPLVPSKIAITTESWPSPLLVKADKGMVEQAILNLALNARDAMPHGGTLAFRTELAPLRGGRTATGEKIPPGDYVSLAVRDTGLGMTSETLAHLFEPFFTTKGLAGGTGLGLATTHGTVRQSEGHIFVQSGKGQGTTFTIYLPVASGHVPLPAGEPAEEEETSQGGRVLLAEDDAVVRFIATSALRKLGYQVHAASDGEEGVKLAETLDGRLDLIVTDVIMPGLRGPDMVRRLRSKGIEAPVLYVSGFTETALKEEGLPAGPWQFLGKPFSVMQLAQKLKEVRRGSAGS